MNIFHCALLVLISIASFAGPPPPTNGTKWRRLPTGDNADAELTYTFNAYSEILILEKIDTSVKGVVAYLNKVRPHKVLPAELDRQIKMLGADGAKERSRAALWLENAGISALTVLQAAAKSKDPEVKKRAQALLINIEGKAFLRRFASATGLLIRYRPKGSAALAMSFLTDADLPHPAPLFVAQAVIRCARPEDAKLLASVVRSKAPLIARKAALRALASVYGEKEQDKFRPFLKCDDPQLRLIAAGCAAHLCDPNALPTLIDLLTVPDAKLAAKASPLLCQLTGREFVIQASDSMKVRKAVAATWQVWMQENKRKMTLNQLTASTITSQGLWQVFPDEMIQKVMKNMIMLPHFVDQQNDSLAEIAEMYGSKVAWLKIANPGMKTDADLRARKEIRVPVEDLDGGE